MDTIFRFDRKRAPFALALAALSILAGCTGRPDGVEPVRGFDAARYEGRWYEIARLDHRFERGLSNVTAEYSRNADGSLRVVNRGFDRAGCRWREAEGRAALQGPADTASLSVTFFWPFAGGYHVIALDRERYQWSLVSGPDRGYLWILARTPDLAPAIRERLIEQARTLGFPVAELIRVDHGPAQCSPARSN